MNPTIKAICFDLDGVFFTPQGKQSFHQALSAEFGADPAHVDEFMFRSDIMRSFVTGKITASQFWEHLRQQTGITAPDDELVTRWIRDYEINPAVLAAVQSARKQGYKTCVCTNNNAARLPALEEAFNFYKEFDVVVSSHEVGHAKPNTEIFKVLVEKLMVLPPEIVYADDNSDRLQGARDLGITVFVYENFDQFLRELSQLGVTL